MALAIAGHRYYRSLSDEYKAMEKYDWHGFLQNPSRAESLKSATNQTAQSKKPLFFAAVQQNRTITIENATKLWVEQAWLCDAGAELMNVEGFCRERMQSKVRQPKVKAALVNVVVMRPKDRPQHHS